MNRAEIVDNIADATGLTRKEVSAVVEGVLKLIESELVNGGTVELRRFGTFRVSTRAARRAVNPRTGEPIEVGAKLVPTFKPSPILREAVSKDKN